MGICMGLLIAKKAYPSLIERIAFMYYILLACVRHGSLPIMTSTNFISRTPKNKTPKPLLPGTCYSFLDAGFNVQLANFLDPCVHRIVTNWTNAVHQTHGQLKRFSVSESFSKLIHDIWLRCTTGYFASTWQVKDGQQSLSMERMASIWEI